MRKVAFFLLMVSFGINVFALDIKSDAFVNKGYIPDRYTCDAKDFSPDLSWSGAPADTKSFVIICDDPDAPFGTWVHWVIFNIPGGMNELKENIGESELSSLGIIRGKNDFKKLDYCGPCLPKGKPHRYFFKLYALNTTLSLEEGATKKDIINSMKGHILAEAKIVGLYQRK